MQTVRNACLCGIDCFVWDIDALQYAIDENANAGCKSVAASSSAGALPMHYLTKKAKQR